MAKTKEELAEEMRLISNQIGELKRKLRHDEDMEIQNRIKHLQIQVLFYMQTIENME